jgi:transaldolase
MAATAMTARCVTAQRVRLTPATAPASRARAFARPRVRAARPPSHVLRASHIGGEEMDVYDDADVDYSGNLCLFLDSASEEEWAKWLPSGIFAGVTTNPIILERDGRECNVAALTELARQALEYDAVQEFQVQTWGESSDEMWKNGIALAKYDPDVIVVKVPATFDGIKAANALVADGIRVTLTAAYASHQAVLAAAVGANYVAPYLGRMNDAGRDGFGTIVEMQKTADKLDSDMRILVASVRNVADIAKLAAEGCDTFTISAKVAEDMFADPLTQQAAIDFDAAAERIGAYAEEKAAAAAKEKEERANEGKGNDDGEASAGES